MTPCFQWFSPNLLCNIQVLNCCTNSLHGLVIRSNLWENVCHLYWLAHWIIVKSLCPSILYYFLSAKKLLIFIQKVYCSSYILEKWGVSMQVHFKFKLIMETLYLIINPIDWYLNVWSVSRKKLQLVGVTTLLQTIKYEEIWAHEIQHFAWHRANNVYIREQILNRKKTMLNTL